jgi:HlyD family secretion protein
MADTEDARRRSWALRIGIPVALVATVALMRVTVLAPDPLEVRVASIERGRVESIVTNSKAGTIRTRRRSQVTAEVGGRVAEILHRSGARVRAGEPLVRLNDSSQRAQRTLSETGVVVAAANRREACLRRDRASRELARSQKLSEQRIVSDDMLDELEFGRDAAAVACNAAIAELERARASVAAAVAELDKTVITAPFDGVIAEVNAEVGEWVTPSPPLLTAPAVVDLIDSTSLYVSAPMDEVDSGRIEAGLPAKITVDSRPGEKFLGHVVRVAPYVLDVEAQNRSVEVEVEFDAGTLPPSLLPGTSADVEIVLEAHADALRVPTSALLEGGRILVFEGGRLVERVVEIGLRNWEHVELLSGAQAGDLIVTALDRIEVVAGAEAVALEDVPAPGS